MSRGIKLYPDIKPCPFCGGYAKLEHRSKTYIKGELNYVTYVRCVECNAHGRRVTIHENPIIARTYAIQNWNRRI